MFKTKKTQQTETENINESMTVEVDGPKKKHQCDVCNYECEKKINLEKHKNTKHIDVNNRKGDEHCQVTTIIKSTYL